MNFLLKKDTFVKIYFLLVKSLKRWTCIWKCVHNNGAETDLAPLLRLLPWVDFALVQAGAELG